MLSQLQTGSVLFDSDWLYGVRMGPPFGIRWVTCKKQMVKTLQILLQVFETGVYGKVELFFKGESSKNWFNRVWSTKCWKAQPHPHMYTYGILDLQMSCSNHVDIHDSESGMLLQCPSTTTGVLCVNRFMTDFKGDTEKAKAASRWGRPQNLKLTNSIVWHLPGKC